MSGGDRNLRRQKGLDRKGYGHPRRCSPFPLSPREKGGRPWGMGAKRVSTKKRSLARRDRVGARGHARILRGPDLQSGNVFGFRESLVFSGVLICLRPAPCPLTTLTAALSPHTAPLPPSWARTKAGAAARNSPGIVSIIVLLCSAPPSEMVCRRHISKAAGYWPIIFAVSVSTRRLPVRPRP